MPHSRRQARISCQSSAQRASLQPQHTAWASAPHIPTVCLCKSQAVFQWLMREMHDAWSAWQQQHCEVSGRDLNRVLIQLAYAYAAVGGAFHVDRGARVEVSNTEFINNTVRCVAGRPVVSSAAGNISSWCQAFTACRVSALPPALGCAAGDPQTSGDAGADGFCMLGCAVMTAVLPCAVCSRPTVVPSTGRRRVASQRSGPAGSSTTLPATRELPSTSRPGPTCCTCGTLSSTPTT